MVNGRTVDGRQPPDVSVPVLIRVGHFQCEYVGGLIFVEYPGVECNAGIELYDLLEVRVAEDSGASFLGGDMLRAEPVHEPPPIYDVICRRGTGLVVVFVHLDYIFMLF